MYHEKQHEITCTAFVLCKVFLVMPLESPTSLFQALFEQLIGKHLTGISNFFFCMTFRAMPVAVFTTNLDSSIQGNHISFF